MKNTFIVLEGCEGTGKSTQMAKIREYLPNAVFFREPGGTDFAEKEMRRLMLTSEYAPDLSPFEQMNLAFAGRSHNIRTTVIPAHQAGKVAVTDRFDASTFAYQIFGMQGGDGLYAHFDSNRTNMGPLAHLPSLYIVLDVPVEVGMARVAKRENDKKGTSNHFDTRGADFHSRVRDGYRRFEQLNKSSVKVVDASKSIEAVWEDVRKAIDDHLASQNR